MVVSSRKVAMEGRWNQQDLLVNLAGVILGNGVSILVTEWMGDCNSPTQILCKDNKDAF